MTYIKLCLRPNTDIDLKGTNIIFVQDTKIRPTLLFFHVDKAKKSN